MLAVLVACLSLFAHPSGKASADPSSSTLPSTSTDQAAQYGVSAQARFGCSTSTSGGTDNGFVEITITRQDTDATSPDQLQLQAGLEGSDPVNVGQKFPEGGPSLVGLGPDATTTVRLALPGPVQDGDQAYVRLAEQADQPELVTMPLPNSCKPSVKPTDFGLTQPGLQVAAPQCNPGSKADLAVTLDNPNGPNSRQLERLNIDQIDYTVLLVRQDGVLAGKQATGQLMSFTSGSTSGQVNLSQVAAVARTYEVRVISLDGAVVKSGSLVLDCASQNHPGPSSSPPTPPSSSTPAPSHSPTSSPVRAPSSPPVTHSASPSATHTAVPVPAVSPSATNTPAAPAPGPGNGPVGGGVAAGNPASGNAASGSTVATTAARPRVSPSAPPPVPQPTAEPGARQARTILVEPSPRLSSLLSFQREVAIVLLLFVAALSGLVGTTIVNARRR